MIDVFCKVCGKSMSFDESVKHYRKRHEKSSYNDKDRREKASDFYRRHVMFY